MTQPIYPDTFTSQLADLQSAVLQLQTHHIPSLGDQNGNAMVDQAGLNIGGVHVATGSCENASFTAPVGISYIVPTQTNPFQVVTAISGPQIATGFWAFGYNNTSGSAVIVDSQASTAVSLTKYLWGQFIFQYFTLTATQDTGAQEIILNGAPWLLGTFTLVWSYNNSGSSAQSLTGINSAFDLLSAGFIE